MLYLKNTNADINCNIESAGNNWSTIKYYSEVKWLQQMAWVITDSALIFTLMEWK